MAFDAQGEQVIGRLPNDRPHVFKVQGGYTLPCTSLVLDYLLESGRLESTMIDQQGRETSINNRGDLGRVDMPSRIDLRVQHEFRLSAVTS